MLQHNKSRIRRIITLVITICLLLTSVVCFSGCESSHPNANITLSFEGTDGVKEYTLKYKLYRNCCPQTVRRFIELADADYYDGMVVHDYSKDSIMKTGGYQYADKDNSYEEFTSKPLPDGLTQSVYYNNEPTNTLIGEFATNNFTIKNDGVSWGVGCLVFNYEDAVYEGKKLVDVKTSSGDDAQGDYKYNAATSEFYINLSSSASKQNNFCAFATLEDAKPLEELIAYVDLYIAEMQDDNTDYSFTQSVTKKIYSNDIIADEIDCTFSTPVQRITIKSVEITKH